MATRRLFLQLMAAGGCAPALGDLAGSIECLTSTPTNPGPDPDPAPGTDPDPGPTPGTHPPLAVGEVLLDYSAGVPSGASVAAAGFAGAVRYCSAPREPWMLGKPVKAAEVADFHANGLVVVSCYQYGKGATADWKGGYAGGVDHAGKGLAIHNGIGGPADRPIYAAIDDNPTADQLGLVADYLRGWESVIGHARTGVYANYPTIEHLRSLGLGSWYWMHNWGSGGMVHPAAHLHQYAIDSGTVDGVGIDRNRVLKADVGQW